MSVDHLIDECKRIENDSLYTAETHYIIATSLKRIGFWTKLFPAIVTAASGSASVLSLLSWINWLTIGAALFTALGVVYDPERTFHDHTSAAKEFTVLRQKARYLNNTHHHDISQEEFSKLVSDLRERYNELVYTTPQTSPKHFKIAQKRIKSGIHTPDFEG